MQVVNFKFSTECTEKDIGGETIPCSKGQNQFLLYIHHVSFCCLKAERLLNDEVSVAIILFYLCYVVRYVFYVKIVNGYLKLLANVHRKYFVKILQVMTNIINHLDVTKFYLLSKMRLCYNFTFVIWFLLLWLAWSKQQRNHTRVLQSRKKSLDSHSKHLVIVYGFYVVKLIARAIHIFYFCEYRNYLLT